MSHSEAKPEKTVTTTATSDQPELPPRPPGPNLSYRNLWPKLNDLHPEAVTIIETNSRGFVNMLESYMQTDAAIRSAPQADKGKKRKRDLAEKLSTKLESVKKERKVIEKARGSMPATIVDGASIAKRPKKGEVTLDDVKKKNTELFMGDSHTGARAFGHHKGELNLMDGGVEALLPDVKIGEQTRQYLGHISEVFFEKVEGMEVESMLVNGRVLVSANETERVEAMAGFSLATLLSNAAKAVNADLSEAYARDGEKVVNANHARRRYEIGVMGEALKVIPKDTNLNDAQRAGAERLAAAAAGYHVDHDSRKDLEALLLVIQHQVRNLTSVQGPYSIDQAAQKIVDPAFKNAVIAVKPVDGGKSHAEQHLALAYIKSGYRGKAVVAGTKNPCATCWLSLALVHQAGFAIEFNNTPGAYWDTTVFRGLGEIARVLGVTDITNLWKRFVATGTLLKGGHKQYLTALWENTQLIVKVPKEGGGLKEKGYVQDISRLSQYPMDIDNEPLGSPYAPPSSPPTGGWDTPPTSPSRQEAERAQAELDEWVKQQKLRQQQAEQARQDGATTTTANPQVQSTSGQMDMDPNVS
jgi:hypothetical protein